MICLCPLFCIIACVYTVYLFYSNPYIEVFGLNLPRPLQAFPGSYQLTSWGQRRGRRTGRRKRSRRGGRTPPGLNRTAERNRGESRSDRDKSLKTETHSPGLYFTMKLIWIQEPKLHPPVWHGSLSRLVSWANITQDILKRTVNGALLKTSMLLFKPAGGSGDASSGVHLSVQAAGEAPGSAGGGEEAAGSLQQRERRAVQPARRTREAAEARRYSSGNSVPVSSVRWSFIEVFLMFCLAATCFMNVDLFTVHVLWRRITVLLYLKVLLTTFLFLFSVKALLSSGGLFQGKRWFRGPNSKLTFALFWI